MRHARLVRVTGLAAAMAIVVCVGACDSKNKRHDAGAVDQGTRFDSAILALNALKGEWRVVELGGKRIDRIMPDGDVRRPPGMTIRDDRTVAGFSGVNQFGTQIDADELTRGHFKLGPIAMTRMAGPPEMMRIEHEFAGALEEQRRYTLRGDELVLLTDDTEARVLVRFQRQAASDVPK